MEKRKRLLILGASFRRKKKVNPVPAIDLFDGLFFRIAKKYLNDAKDLEIAVMIDDLTLVDSSTLIPYCSSEGAYWGRKKISTEAADKARVLNMNYLKKKTKTKAYRQIFVALGKEYAIALPDLEPYGVIAPLPTKRGIGPKAKALKEWLDIKK